MTFRVLLVDDHPAVRLGIRNALAKAQDITVVGEASTGEEALRLVEEQRPDVILLDCRLSGLSGVEVAAQLQHRGLPGRVIALSAYAQDHYVYGMLRAGAVGYLLKEEALETVVEAVCAVARGEEWYSRPVMTKVVAWARGETSMPPGIAELTERELEVLRLLGRGWNNQRIADELVISEGTVKNHVVSIYDKINVCSRAQAVAWAWKHDLMKER